MAYLRTVGISLCIMPAASFYTSNGSCRVVPVYVAEQSSEWSRMLEKSRTPQHIPVTLKLHISCIAPRVGGRIGMCLTVKQYGCTSSA